MVRNVRTKAFEYMYTYDIFLDRGLIVLDS